MGGKTFGGEALKGRLWIYRKKAIFRRSLERDLARLDRVQEEYVGAISALPETALDQTVVGKPYTIRFMLDGAIRHHVYHSGQIALLKESLGSRSRQR